MWGVNIRVARAEVAEGLAVTYTVMVSTPTDVEPSGAVAVYVWVNTGFEAEAGGGAVDNVGAG